LDAGPLGQFKLPVTITPASNTIFFIDPVNGNDDFPGTAAQPWQKVANALKATETTGSRVAAVASAGNDVVVTILAGGIESAAATSTPDLLAGSVTVLKAPSAGTFTLDMGNNQLTLNKGYKLQDIKITSSVGSSNTAVQITHPTAGLASVEVECTGSGVTCVKVEGAGSHTLKDVKVRVRADSGNVGIQNDANANLIIVGGRVELTGNDAAITLINAQGVLTATGLTVDMTGGINSAASPPTTVHRKGSIGILLNAARSSVTGSTIKVNNGPGSGGSNPNAIGIDVQHSSTVKSTVVSNNFIGSGNAVGIRGGGSLSPDPNPPNNTFSGSFVEIVQ
jgi:hypothetical protein